MQVQEIGESCVLRPEIKQFLDNQPPAEANITPEQAREDVRKAIFEEWSDCQRVFNGTVKDKRIAAQNYANLIDPPKSNASLQSGPRKKEHTIPVRIYKPEKENNLPLLVFFHGGGWMQCDIDTHDQMCKMLAASIPAVVVSAGYRLAPEHKFSAGLRDCYDTLVWSVTNGKDLGSDTSQIIVAGDSAGGNLAAAVSTLARDKGGISIGCQLLLYPVTDVSSFERNSYKQYGKGYMLTPGDMEWYRDLYIKEPSEAENPLVSPLLGKNFFGLPPAHIVTAEFDILRDEGELYAEKLSQDNVPVTCTRYNGVIHGFLSMDKFVIHIEDIYREIGKNVRTHLANT